MIVHQFLCLLESLHLCNIDSTGLEARIKLFLKLERLRHVAILPTIAMFIPRLAWPRPWVVLWGHSGRGLGGNGFTSWGSGRRTPASQDPSTISSSRWSRWGCTGHGGVTRSHLGSGDIGGIIEGGGCGKWRSMLSWRGIASTLKVS